MFNSIGPLAFLALFFVFLATFGGGFAIGVKSRSSDADHKFSVFEWAISAVTVLLIGAAIFFAYVGESNGAVFFGWLASFATGIVWGLSRCEFGHVRMM